jgi:signal transduction histidine kinase
MVCWLLWGHAVGLVAFAIVRGFGVAHGFEEGSVVALAAAVASWNRLGRTLRTAVGALGLVLSSAILVHLSGGTIEAHFHFFVMVAVIILYQDWVPFLIAFAFVGVHHGLMGAIDPDSVYNHPAAHSNPWGWAAIHASFVLSASLVQIISWRMSENEHKRAEGYATKLYAQQLRQRQALEINDTVVQGLAVAKYALDLGDGDRSREAVESTLVKARGIIADLLGEPGALLEPGDLVRAQPAAVGEEP